MSTAELLVDVLGPVVLLVAIGAVAGPRLRIEAASLSTLAYWVLGPAFVFDLFRASSLDGGEVARLVLAGLAGMVAAALFAVGLGRAIGSDSRQRSAAVLSSAYGNVGNAGLAISVFALGDEALAPAGVLMLTINLSGIALGVALASREGGLAHALGRAALAPMSLAALAAVAVNVTDAGVPLVADRAISLTAGALIPVLLITLGIQLAHTGVDRLGWEQGGVAVAKLAVAPLAAVVVARAVGLEGDLVSVVAIQSAMPPAVFTMVVAMEHDLEPRRVTSALATTTLASLASLPIVLRLVS